MVRTKLPLRPSVEEKGRPRRVRWGVAGGVALFHVIVVIGLVRAFAPDVPQRVARSVTQAFTVVLPNVPPSPDPTPSQATAAPDPGTSREAADSGAAGRRAEPRPVAAPSPAIVLEPSPLPTIAGTGAAIDVGAAASGSGSGAGAAGQGRGSGQGSGAGGAGGGGARPTVKIQGNIDSARDYPRSSRAQRIGASVTVDLSVDTAGKVSACRIVAPSPDPAADRITCDLATRRFRFRPALGSGGEPVGATYRWRQRWFY